MNNPAIQKPPQPGRREAMPLPEFALPPDLEASSPPEARGLRRDQVRMMVSYISNHQVIHSRFDQLPGFLRPGDVLVINTSKTLNAALKVIRTDSLGLELHLSTRLAGNRWVVEVRQLARAKSLPYYALEIGQKLSLPGGGEAVLQEPYPRLMPRNRLWVASLELPVQVEAYLDSYGFPIRYSYVHTQWPLAYYQNVYAAEPGSAEMPSAGRAFTPELITRLVAQGILFAPLVLHTGVASLEKDEKPYVEYYRVPAPTANLINMAHSEQGRVIAVGTTVVRALQTVSDSGGMVHAGEGWTNLVITPGTTLAAIDGLLTGFHEPDSTHLSMLLAIAGYEVIKLAYQQALKKGYLWHEFGDLHLILPAAV